ncbi:MAG: DUF7577 domain-containing protein [Halapricum sp.]
MPGTWIWILVYVLAFGLFQLLLYRYLRDKEQPSFEQATPDYGDIERGPPRPTVTTVETDDDGMVRCPRCGTYNERDSAYTYCKECVQRLR